MFRCEDSHRVMTRFCHPFNIPVTWVSVLVHGDNLSFCYDAIEEFFNVITKYRANVIGELLGVVQEHDVV